MTCTLVKISYLVQWQSKNEKNRKWNIFFLHLSASSKKDVLVIFLGKYKFKNVLKHFRAIFNSYIVISYSLDIANQCFGRNVTMLCVIFVYFGKIKYLNSYAYIHCTKNVGSGKQCAVVVHRMTCIETKTCAKIVLNIL